MSNVVKKLAGGCSGAANSCDLEVGLQAVPFHKSWRVVVAGYQLSVIGCQWLVLVWIFCGSFTACAVQDDTYVKH